MNNTQKAFMKEFKALLRKYNADFEVRCDMSGWYAAEPVAEVSFNYMTDGEYITMKMPSYMNGK